MRTIRTFHLAGLVASVLLGCSARDLNVDLDASEGDLIVVAHASKAGQVLRVEGFVFEKSVPVELEEESLFVFVIPRAQTVDARGEPLSPARFREAQVRIAGSAKSAGSCGRCLVPSIGESQVVLEGASCPPAPGVQAVGFVETDGSTVETREPTELDSIRRQVVIDWPGECACSDQTELLTESLADVVHCLIEPQQAVHPGRVVLTERGELAGQSPGFFIFVSPDGRLEELSDLALRVGINGQTLSLPGETPRFLMLNREPLGAVLVERGSGGLSLQSLELIGMGDQFRIRGGIAVSSHQIELAGVERPGRTGATIPAGYTCRLEESALEVRCEAQEFRTACLGVEESLERVAWRPDGSAFGASARGSLFFRAPGARWNCVTAPGTVGWIFNVDGDVFQADFDEVQLELAGPNMLACVTRADEGVEDALVVTSSIAPLVSDASGLTMIPEIALQAVGVVPGQDCTSAARLPDGHVAFGLDDRDRWLIADPAGVEVRTRFESATDYLSFDRPIAAFASSSNAAIAIGSDGSIFSLQDGADGPVQRFVYGPTVWEPRSLSALAASSSGEVWAATPDGRLLTISAAQTASPSCDGLEIASAESAAVEGAEVMAWTDDGAWLLVAGRGSAGPFLRRIDSSGSMLEDIPVDTSIRAISALVGERFVLLDEQGDAHVFDGGLEPIDGSGGSNWRAVGASEGVAWLVGDSSVGRLLPAEGGYVIEPDWFTRAAEDALRTDPNRVPPILTSVQLTCPDRGVLGGADQRLEVPGKPREDYVLVLEMLEGDTGPQIVERVSRRSAEGNAVIGFADRGRLAFKNGTPEIFNGADGLVLAGGSLIATEASPGVVVTGGKNGYLGAILLPRP